MPTHMRREHRSAWAYSSARRRAGICVACGCLHAGAIADLPVNGSNIVLGYAMDEGTGTTVADSSGNAYDGTITSATQWLR